MRTIRNRGKNVSAIKRDKNKLIFELRTPTGKFSYVSTPELNYTQFLRVVFDGMLGFNKEEINPDLYNAVRSALKLFDSGMYDTFNDEDDSQFGQSRLPNIPFRTWERPFSLSEDLVPIKIEEAKELISKFPKNRKYKLQVFYYDESNEGEIIDLVDGCQSTLSFEEIKDFLSSLRILSLSYKEASELYLKLREKDVILKMIPVNFKRKSPKIVKGYEVLNGNELLHLKPRENKI